MSACKWRRLCKLCTPVANLLDPQVAFCNEVICCVLQLEILGLPALAIAPVLYDQRKQRLSWHRRRVTGGVAIFIAVMHSATPQRRKTAIERRNSWRKTKEIESVKHSGAGGRGLAVEFLGWLTESEHTSLCSARDVKAKVLRACARVLQGLSVSSDGPLREGMEMRTAATLSMKTRLGTTEIQSRRVISNFKPTIAGRLARRHSDSSAAK